MTTPHPASARLPHLHRELGQRLRAARRDAGLVQKEVAKALGISRTTVSNLERGTQRISLEELYLCARLYAVSPGDLLPDCDLGVGLESVGGM